MKKRIDTKRSVRLRRARRAALCLASFAFIFLVAAAFLDAFALQTRLTRSAAARMSRRLSTDPRAIDSLNAVFSTDAPTAGADLRSTDVKRDRDAFLVARAEEWLAAPNERSEETRNRDVVVGLARWNVAPERAAPFLRDPGDAALFSDVERTTLLSERRRDRRTCRGRPRRRDRRRAPFFTRTRRERRRRGRSPHRRRFSLGFVRRRGRSDF